MKKILAALTLSSVLATGGAVLGTTAAITVVSSVVTAEPAQAVDRMNCHAGNKLVYYNSGPVWVPGQWCYYRYTSQEKLRYPFPVDGWKFFPAYSQWA